MNVQWRILLSGYLFIFPNGKALFLDFSGNFVPVNMKAVMQEAPIKEVELDQDEFRLLRTALEAFNNRQRNRKAKKDEVG